jgi:crotonobetainyl-CoA:carnitine CoA-transferase CaiB-like acyl-CoA transferase
MRPGAGALRSTPAGESAYYLSINRNKLSIALDLTDPEDRAAVATAGGWGGRGHREFSAGGP